MVIFHCCSVSSPEGNDTSWAYKPTYNWSRTLQLWTTWSDQRGLAREMLTNNCTGKKEIYSYPDDFKWLLTITLGVKRKYPLKFWSFVSQHDKLSGCDNLGTTLYVWSSGNTVPCVKFNSGTCCSAPCHVSTVMAAMALRPLTVINGIVTPAIKVSYTGWWFQPLWKIWQSREGLYIPNIWENKKNVPNHQPVYIYIHIQYIS